MKTVSLSDLVQRFRNESPTSPSTRKDKTKEKLWFQDSLSCTSTEKSSYESVIASETKSLVNNWLHKITNQPSETRESKKFEKASEKTKDVFCQSSVSLNEPKSSTSIQTTPNKIIESSAQTKPQEIHERQSIPIKHHFVQLERFDDTNLNSCFQKASIEYELLQTTQAFEKYEFKLEALKKWVDSHQ